MTRQIKPKLNAAPTNSGSHPKLAGAICDAFIAMAEIIKAYREIIASLGCEGNLEDAIPAPPESSISTPKSRRNDYANSTPLTKKNRWRAIYIAGSSGLYHDVAEPIGRKVFKIGSVAVNRINRRLAEICSQKYAALAEGSLTENEDFDCWSLCRIDRQLPRSPRVPIEFHKFAWHVQLPHTMTDDDFEDGLRRELEPRSLRAWARSPDGIAYLEGRGIEPGICRRETYLGDVRVRATETLSLLRTD